jgi:hypothetical protein
LTKATTSQNQIFCLSVLQMKISSTCLITASLCKGSFFYFYVESPPSIFMHHLREHSFHSKYNVNCPKVIIDWLIILVSLVLKLFLSSRPLKLEGVLCIYVLLFHEGQAENHLLCFLYDLNTRLTFIVSLFMIFRLCSSSCYNMVAKFLIVKIISSCPRFKFFWSQHSMLTYMIKIVMVHVTSKIILLLSLTYLGMLDTSQTYL